MSIASRIESIEEHIGNAYDSIEALGVDITDIDKNIENISSSIDGIYDTLPKVTDEGESITLDGTIKGRLKTTLKGNTSQNGTPTPDTPIPVNVVSGDNSVSICGKNLFSTNYSDYDTTSDTYGYIKIVDEIPSGKYLVISLIDNDTSVTLSSNFYLMLTSDGTSSSTSKKNPISAGNKPTAPINFYTNTLKYISFYPKTKASFDNMLRRYKIQYELVDNTTATPYEPYTKATYLINLPIENLFNISTITRNQELTTTGETVGSQTWWVSDYIPVVENTSYTNNSNISSNSKCWYDSTKTFISRTTTQTATSPQNAKYCRVNGTLATIDINPNAQFEKGSKSNTYTPYGTTPIELCKIGDYEDTFIHDKTLDKWYLHKEVGKVILNGSEDEWERSATGTNGKYRMSYKGISSIAVKPSSSSVAGALLCNLFNVVDNNSTYNCLNGSLSMRSSNGYIDFYYEDYNNFLSDFKTWLSTHNTNVYYALVTPTNTEITYTPLIEQLNNIEKAMSKQGQTNISQVNNDLPFIISASALKEWQESTSLNSTLSMVNPLSLGNTLNTQEIKNNTQPIEVDNIEPLEEGEYE